MTVYDDVFERYGNHSPTPFDSNINIDDENTNRSVWFKMPVSRTRDSGPLDNSNFECFLDGLGGESETVEVHRFSHWGPGWYEIIIVHPSDHKALEAAYDMACSLETYPVLDENDWSSREYDDFCESWNYWGCSQFCDEIASHYGLTESSKYALRDVDSDEMMQLWMDVAAEPYISESCGVSIRFSDSALSRIGRDRIANLIRSTRK